MLPLFFMIETIGCARPNHECVSRKKIFRTMLNQGDRKGRKPLDRPSHLPSVTLPTFGNHYTFLWLLRKMVATSFHLTIASILKILASSSAYHARTTNQTLHISLSYALEKHFLEIFDCTDNPLNVALGQTSDTCIRHCLSIPALYSAWYQHFRSENTNWNRLWYSFFHTSMH